EWTFGDGETGSGGDVSYTYDAAGTYTARVTVTDVHGIAGSATANVFVGSTPICKGELSTIVGSGGADRLVGTGGRDVIWAGSGDDSIAGLGGDDLICGGPGNDTLD